MNPNVSSARLVEALERADRQRQERRQTAGPPRPAFTIALSREAGTNAPLIARALGQRLGWAVYDRELLQRVAQEMNLRTSLLQHMDEKGKHWLQECMEAFTGGPAASTDAYVRHLLETLLSLAARGECVLVGRGAPQVLPPATTLRVRLVAPLADRIEVIRQRFGFSRAEAARWVQAADVDRVRFVKDHFHKDSTAGCDYDLILNTARFSVEACADIIVEALRRLQGQTASERPPLPAGSRGESL
jgi:cytidylate kinase